MSSHDNDRRMGIRRNSTCGYMDLSFPSHGSIEFMEWFNGEGLDFTILRDGEEVKIGLTVSELEAIFAICMSMDMLDMEKIQDDSIELGLSS